MRAMTARGLNMALVLICWLVGCGCTKHTEPVATAECGVCFFQRPGNLAYIMRRAIGGPHVPSANSTFGHCFVCTQCVGDTKADCRGWWPQDPSGGDYEGDDGQILNDDDEAWTSGQCHEISRREVHQIAHYIDDYTQRTSYQVINRSGGRGCLGFCVDVADQVGMRSVAPVGNLTIPGRLRFPDSDHSLTNSNRHNVGVAMASMLSGVTTGE